MMTVVVGKRKKGLVHPPQFTDRSWYVSRRVLEKREEEHGD